MELLSIPPHRVYITGYAGTGKSTLLANFVNEQKEDILILTPTHKARNVLEHKITNTRAEIRTIHSLLKLIPQINEEAKSVKYIDTLSKSTLEKIATTLPRLVVLDEAGMIDSSHFELLIDLMSINTTYPREVFLFLDPYQLTPVKGHQIAIQHTDPITLEDFDTIRDKHDKINTKLSRFIFSKLSELDTILTDPRTKESEKSGIALNYYTTIEEEVINNISWTHLNLTKQHRSQKHITSYYENVIKCIKHSIGEPTELPKSIKPPKELTITKEEALTILKDSLKNDKSFRYLAYTNKAVGEFLQFYKDTNTKEAYTEENIQLGNYEILNYYGIFKNVPDIALTHSTFYNIKGVIDKTFVPYIVNIVSKSKNLYWVKAKVIEPRGKVFDGYILAVKNYYTHYRLTQQVNKKLIEFNTLNRNSELKRQFMSQKFYPIRLSVPFDYNFATTVHKAQGSEFDTVVINYTDLKTLYSLNKTEFYRLLYVASSRAINNLYFIE